VICGETFHGKNIDWSLAGGLWTPGDGEYATTWVRHTGQTTYYGCHSGVHEDSKTAGISGRIVFDETGTPIAHDFNDSRNEEVTSGGGTFSATHIWTGYAPISP
jgi:hypothetical protein